jgi:hypothetical protein
MSSHFLHNKHTCEADGCEVQWYYIGDNTMRSESRCALRLRYVDLVVSVEVAVEVCCCCVPLHCIQLLNSGVYSLWFFREGNRYTDLVEEQLPTPFTSAQRLSEHTAYHFP